ncbi:MAG: class I SAM-dependent methyltransferase [Planctomycetota bacterium]
MSGPEALRARLRKMARHYGKWARRQGIEAYRIYDRDVPGYAAAIDRYGDAVHVQVYEPKRSIPEEQADRDAAEIESAVIDALAVEPSNVFMKTRRRQRDFGQYQRLEKPRAKPGRKRPAPRTVSEGGLRFEINLTDHLDTGLFLDHRLTRAMVAERAPGARVLNLFCYTGSFTVYAAAAGASRTLSIDLSKTYLEWGRRNLALNDLASAAHTWLSADVVSWLSDSRTMAEGPFDVIVLDPPTFSRSKRMEGVLDVGRDHPRLIAQCLDRLAPGGAILFSTNQRRFRLLEDELPACEVREITGQTVPLDFRRHPPHRAFWITRAGE